MKWFVWMWRVALSLAATEARPGVTCRLLISKIEMAMRCRGVVGGGWQ